MKTQAKKRYKFNAFQKRWLKALETGEFKQARHQLCKVNGKRESFCCLGVACELHNRRKGVKKLETEVCKIDKEKRYQGRGSDLPEIVQTGLQLRDKMGIFHWDFDSEHDSLADMNDNGCTHRYIAKFIRTNPDAVFVQ